MFLSSSLPSRTCRCPEPLNSMLYPSATRMMSESHHEALMLTVLLRFQHANIISCTPKDALMNAMSILSKDFKARPPTCAVPIHTMFWVKEN